MEKIIVEFAYRGEKIDIEIPCDINGDELVNALKEAFSLELPVDVLYAQRPFCEIGGQKTLREIGLRNGSLVSVEKTRDEHPTFETKRNTRLLQYPNFMRSTRVVQRVEESTIEVLPPKPKHKEQKDSLFISLFPTVGMVLLMVLLRGTMGGGASFVLYSVGMSVVTLIATLLARNYQKKRHSKEEDQRRNHYLSYLEAKIEEIVMRLQEEIRLRHRLHRPLDESLEALNNYDKGLFDRSCEDDDFLDVRIGTGMVKAATKVQSPVQEYVDVEDDLVELPKEIEAKYRYLDNAPIILRLSKNNSVGIVGDEESQYNVLKEISLDLVLRQYEKEMRLYFIISECNLGKFAWAKWLPNCQYAGNSHRTLIYNDASAKVNLEQLYRVLSSRESVGKEVVWTQHYVVFVYDMVLIRNHPISQYFEKSQKLGVTFLFFVEAEEDLPRGCDEFLRLDRDDAMGSLINAKWQEPPKRFTYPIVDEKTLLDTALTLAPIRVVESSLEAEMTKAITFYQLLGFDQVDELDFGYIWQKANVEKSLAVPLGVKVKNEMVFLDVHEKAHGPHGLVAGTTGSGKSEVLQSYLLSLAVHFHPHEVSFLLIDFKGGGMANQLKALPHLLGSITNMEGREVQRSLKSIKAELLRRQALFAQAGMSSIDGYIKERKQNKSKLPPLPHLLIVVDEFAELKAEQPDFMSELVSAARIGRSLGVHLILSTQKPSGVVDSQIWSNSRFKLCLKVQSKEDSNEVLHTPLAAEIREPGRAYLQVGSNEIFELFQTAYSGAPVYPKGEKRSFSISVLDFWGNPTQKFAFGKSGDQEAIRPSELKVLTKSISAFCTKESIAPLPAICLPPLKDEVELDEINGVPANSQFVAPIIGVLDNPELQQQGAYALDITEGNTFILGASQSGKSWFLLTILMALSNQYASNNVNVYIMDFSNGLPKALEQSSIVGGICYREEEERIVNLLEMIRREMSHRRNLFAAQGVGSYKAYVQVNNAHPLPAVIIMVDNIVSLKEIYEEHYDTLCSLLREGPGLGIYFVVTSTQSTVFLSRTMVAFDIRLALHCNDTQEYATLFDRYEGVPKNVAGRGLVMLDKKQLEFQVALPAPGVLDRERIENMVKALVANNSKSIDKASPIPMVPDILALPSLLNAIESHTPCAIPLGLNYEGVVPVSIELSKQPYLPVVGKERSGKTNLCRLLLVQLEMRKEKEPVRAFVLDGKTRGLARCQDLSMVEQYTMQLDDAKLMLAEIVQELEERQDWIVTNNADDDVYLQDKPYFVFAIGSHAMFNSLAGDTEAADLLERFQELYRYKGIIIIDGFANTNIGYGSPKASVFIRDAKTALLTDALENINAFPISVPTINQNKKPLRLGDAYWYQDGRLLCRVHAALADSN